MPRIDLVLGALAALAAASCAPASAETAAAPPRAWKKVEHVIVIYLENHSFDNLFGLFPGAEG